MSQALIPAIWKADQGRWELPGLADLRSMLKASMSSLVRLDLKIRLKTYKYKNMQLSGRPVAYYIWDCRSNSQCHKNMYNLQVADLDIYFFNSTLITARLHSTQKTAFNFQTRQKIHFFLPLIQCIPAIVSPPSTPLCPPPQFPPPPPPFKPLLNNAHLRITEESTWRGVRGYSSLSLC